MVKKHSDSYSADEGESFLDFHSAPAQSDMSEGHRSFFLSQLPPPIYSILTSLPVLLLLQAPPPLPPNLLLCPKLLQMSGSLRTFTLSPVDVRLTLTTCVCGNSLHSVYVCCISRAAGRPLWPTALATCMSEPYLCVSHKLYATYTKGL